MTPEMAAEIAEILDSRLSDVECSKLFRPDRWTLGVCLSSGQVLGFCWHPHNAALGFCSWAWPRGRVEDLLSAGLKRARIESVTAIQNESIIRINMIKEGRIALVWENVGRSSNLLLLDEDDAITWSGRVLKGRFRSGAPGDRWRPPPPQQGGRRGIEVWNVDEYLTERGGEIVRRGLMERGRKAALNELGRRNKALSRRCEAVRGDIEEGRRWAELEGPARALIALGIGRERGLGSKVVVDYSIDPPVEVELQLDASKTINENAKVLFSKARRGRARMEKGPLQLRLIEKELDALEGEKARILASEELTSFYKDGQRRKKASDQPRRTLPSDVARVTLPMGYAGYAGKNAKGNDRVSFQLSRGSDFWFHARDYPGCHVVVRNSGRKDQLPPVVESTAARYAAENSGAPKGRTAVIATQCKYLKRVRSAPGKVMISKRRIVLVDR